MFKIFYIIVLLGGFADAYSSINLKDMEPLSDLDSTINILTNLAEIQERDMDSLVIVDSCKIEF